MHGPVIRLPGWRVQLWRSQGTWPPMVVPDDAPDLIFSRSCCSLLLPQKASAAHETPSQRPATIQGRYSTTETLTDIYLSRDARSLEFKARFIMASSQVDLGQLSESQRSALEMYTSVTNQEPSSAIPLLQRSQWNVQVCWLIPFKRQPKAYHLLDRDRKILRRRRTRPRC